MAILEQCANGHYYNPAIYAACPYCARAGADAAKPVSPAAADDAAKARAEDGPSVVGWLVAVKGPDRGRSLALCCAGGGICSREGDVDLPGDPGIAYEEGENRFRLTAGESDCPVLVDGAPVPEDGSVELRPYSCVGLGGSEFLFVPFCCARFRWSDRRA